MPGLTGHLLYRPTGTKMGTCVPGGMKNRLRGTKQPSCVPGCRSRSQVEIRPFPFAGPSVPLAKSANRKDFTISFVRILQILGLSEIPADIG